MAGEHGGTRRVRSGESYWSIAGDLLHEDAPGLAADEAYVRRIHRRLIQLNQHRNASADMNLLQLDEMVLPAMSDFLRAPHAPPNGQTRSGLTAPELWSGLSAGVSFRGAIFTSDVVLDVLDIQDDVCFCGAVFQGSLTVTRLRIEGYACFEGADFHGQVTLRDVVVRGDLSFDAATFRRDLILERAQVLGSLSLSNARLQRDAWVGALVEQVTYFGFLTGAPGGFYLRDSSSGLGTYCANATFEGSLHVLDHRSRADLAITQSTVAGELGIERCVVDGAFSGRRLDVTGECRIEDVRAARADFWKLHARASAFMTVKADEDVSMLFLRVDGAANLQIDAGSLDGSGMLLAEGGDVLVSEGSLVFEGASFPATTILRGTGEGVRPRLSSLLDSRVTGLALARLDAGGCYFEGAHDLDRLRVEDDVTWREVPRAGRYRWATRRQVLHEEALLRAGRGDRHWSDGEPAGQATRAENRRAARRVADQYRALRKGFEDRKNEPGAADFYYGEMEMRRLGAAGRAERFLLTMYWLLSGYSLRAWRSLAALFLLIAISTVVVAWRGFEPPPAPTPQLVAVGPQGRVESLFVDPADGAVSTSPPAETHDGFGERLLPALTYSAESATVVFRGPETHSPTLLGRWCQVLLRLIGPALLALAVVSLRGRVKR